MKHMRVIWKDTNAKNRKTVKYRGYYITSCGSGWSVDLPGDDNVYRTHYCAQNAIDAALGGTGTRGRCTPRRESYGIQIIGKKDTTLQS